MNGLEIAKSAACIAEEKRGENIIVYDVSERSELCNYIVLISADNRIQAKAIIDGIHEYVKKTFKENPRGREGGKDSQWLLLDYFDVMIHVFSPELREYYNIEGLWGDSEKVDYLN